MPYQATFSAPITEDFVLDMSATDADTGAAIDFSSATAITFMVGTSRYDQQLTASLANGKITLPTTTTMTVTLTVTDLSALDTQTYKIGMTIEFATGETAQLLYGTLSLYDGIVTT